MTPTSFDALVLQPSASVLQRKEVDRLVSFFELLSPDNLPQITAVYAPDAWFKDPFNEVRGLAEVHRIFSHMYQALDHPRFVVTNQIVDGSQCFLTWDFEFHFKRFDRATLQTVRGGSHVKFNDKGLVEFHRDYWDAAEELYEKLPVVGGLMRWLKKRARE